MDREEESENNEEDVHGTCRYVERSNNSEKKKGKRRTAANCGMFQS